MADENANAAAPPAATFEDLAPAAGAAKPGGAVNLELIRDIQVGLTVELGRTRMLIEEVLALTPGQVIELDKLAGEPLDVLINGKVLARGEVVVVDDHYGIRITAIEDPRTRVQALKPERP